MREARIILPLAVPQEVREDTLNEIIAEFGGYTAFNGTGAWMDPKGEVISEAVLIVDIAIHGSPVADIVLERTAHNFLKASGQDAVYVRNFLGKVHIISQPEKKEAA